MDPNQTLLIDTSGSSRAGYEIFRDLARSLLEAFDDRINVRFLAVTITTGQAVTAAEACVICVWSGDGPFDQSSTHHWASLGTKPRTELAGSVNQSNGRPVISHACESFLNTPSSKPGLPRSDDGEGRLERQDTMVPTEKRRPPRRDRLPGRVVHLLASSSLVSEWSAYARCKRACCARRVSRSPGPRRE
jgi:hypothetical protein